jgi:hypothetical protein
MSGKASEEQILRYMRMLAKVDDQTLVILKGHLLLEEIMNRIIEQSVSNPKFLRKLHGFSLKLTMVRSLDFEYPESEAWKLIKELNELRNALVHHLEPPELEGKVRTLIDHYFELGLFNRDAFDEGKETVNETLKLLISFCMGVLERVENASMEIRESILEAQKSYIERKKAEWDARSNQGV